MDKTTNEYGTTSSIEGFSSRHIYVRFGENNSIVSILITSLPPTIKQVSWKRSASEEISWNLEFPPTFTDVFEDEDIDDS